MRDRKREDFRVQSSVVLGLVEVLVVGVPMATEVIAGVHRGWEVML